MKDMITGKEISGEYKSIPYYQGEYLDATYQKEVDRTIITTHYQVQTEPSELIVSLESWQQREKWAKFWKVYHIILFSFFIIGLIVLLFDPEIHIAFLVGPMVIFFVMFMIEIALLNFQAKKKGWIGVRGASAMQVFSSPALFLTTQYRSTLDIDPKIKFFTEKEYQQLKKETVNT